MSIEVEESDLISQFNHSYSEEGVSKSKWNGRNITLKGHGNKRLNELAFMIPKNIPQPKAITCSMFGGYFDPEAKKAQEFEVAVLLHAIHCQSPEQ